MKQIILILAVTIALSSLLAESPIGLTVRMKGNITLTRDEATNPLNEGSPLLNNDVVRSYDESFALIKFVDDGATLRLFENSVLSLNAEKEDDKLHKNNYLQVGNVFTSVRRNRGDLSIETPTTVASVKGTDGFIIVDEVGNTLIIVINGTFEVYNKQSQVTIEVGAGNTCSSDSSGEMDVFETTDIDEEWLEDIEDLMHETDIYRIEMMNEEGDIKTIEIEVD